MSTLQVSNISDGTTTVGTEYVVNGSAKAWNRFDADVPSINDSYNVASLTDNSSGDFTTNFTNSMANSNYSAVTSAGDVGVPRYSNPDSYSSSSYDVITEAGSGAPTDFSFNNHIVQGDLA